MSQNELTFEFTDSELFRAALLLASRTNSASDKADEANSRKTASSFLLIAKDGEILARIKLSAVYQQCKTNRRALGSSKTQVVHSEPKDQHASSNVELVKTKLSQNKYRLGIAFALFLSLVGIFVSCSSYYDGRSKTAMRERLDKVLEDWDTDVRIASSTARIALASPVLKLREYLDILDRTRGHACFDESRSTLKSYMSKTIDAYVSFMSKEEVKSSLLQAEATSLRKEYESSLKKCE